MDDLPLTKSLGYSEKHMRNLKDAAFNREYIEQYQEMLKASEETHGSVHGEDLRPHRTDGRRQRHAYQINSPIRIRRARSEAVRRERLNSQGLKSHLEHTRQLSIEDHSNDSI